MLPTEHNTLFKMYFRNYIFAAFLLFGMNFITVHGLQCYVCNPIKPGEKECGSLKEGDTEFLVNCSAPYNKSCRKISFMVKKETLNQTMDDERIIRQCASNPYNPQKPCYKKSGMGGTVRVCDCGGDKCNEVSRIASTLFLTTVLLLLIGWLSKN